MDRLMVRMGMRGVGRDRSVEKLKEGGGKGLLVGGLV